MTTLICSGPLFSNWASSLEKPVLGASKQLPVYNELSTLSESICRQNCPAEDELTWKPFTPDKANLEVAVELLSRIKNESVFAWADTNSSLLLNFWKAARKDSRFVLFYCSPEYQVGQFIKTHEYDETRLARVLDAWLIRTRSMLTFFMHNRDRCLLVDVRSATSENSAFIQNLNTHFHLELEDAKLPISGNTEISPLLEYLATSLLLENHKASELYDEVRSAATVLCETDKSITGIRARNQALISAFITEAKAYQQLIKSHSELEDDLSLNQLQIDQMAEELEHYFKSSTEQEKIVTTMANYLSNDPLLKIARQVRQSQ